MVKRTWMVAASTPTGGLHRAALWFAAGAMVALLWAWAARAQGTANVPDPTEPVSQAWVGWGVNYLCAKDGYVLSSWLNYAWAVLGVPIAAQLLRNLRRVWPGIDGIKVLQFLALHFINAQPPGVVTTATETVTQTKP